MRSAGGVLGQVVGGLVTGKGPASYAETLAGLKSLAWLSPEQIGRLAEGVVVESVRRRGAIFRQGDTAARVYVLLSGVAKLSCPGREGEEVLVSLVAPGEIFGVASFLPDVRRPFLCEAFTDCMVGALEPDLFVATTLGVPFADFSRVLDVTVGRWWGWLLRYTSFAGLSLAGRLGMALLELALKFGVKDSRGTILTLRLSHADLADLVGASRQRVTKHIQEFERRRMIMRDGRRLIVLAEKLEDYVRRELAT